MLVGSYLLAPFLFFGAIQSHLIRIAVHIPDDVVVSVLRVG